MPYALCQWHCYFVVEWSNERHKMGAIVLAPTITAPDTLSECLAPSLDQARPMLTAGCVQNHSVYWGDVRLYAIAFCLHLVSCPTHHADRRGACKDGVHGGARLWPGECCTRPSPCRMHLLAAQRHSTSTAHWRVAWSVQTAHRTAVRGGD